MIRSFCSIIIILITSTCLGKGQNLNLDQVCEYIKIWGLIKNYQPQDQSICPDMDSIFFAHINLLQNKSTKRQFNKIAKDSLDFAGNLRRPDPMYQIY